MTTYPTTGTSMASGTDDASVKDKASAATSKAVDKVGGVTSQATDQVREKASQATSKVREQALEKADERKSQFVEHGFTLKDELESTAQKLRDEGHEKPADIALKVTSQLDGGLNYFETHTVSEMLTDVTQIARRNPVTFLGVMFGAGFLASRLFKADPNQSQTYNPQWETTSQFQTTDGTGGTESYATAQVGTMAAGSPVSGTDYRS